MKQIRRIFGRMARKAPQMTREVAVQDLIEQASIILRNNGLPEDEVVTVVAHLLDCELKGKASHGFYRLPSIVRALKNSKESASPIVVERDTSASALVNGGAHLGLVAADRAMELAIEKARAASISVVGAYNYVGTTGTMGYYARKAADDNLIAIVFCNSEYAVAPTGGRRAILGTNPISLAIPSSHDPIVADLATSAWSYGDLALAMRANRRIPEGIVVDKDGNPSTNPHDADDGAQLPMAGHKGFALGLAIELLAGPLIRAKAGRDSIKGSDGFLCIVLNPAAFVEISTFEEQVSMFTNEVKSSPLAPNSKEILMPGEQSDRVKRRNIASGTVQINESVLTELEALLP